MADRIRLLISATNLDLAFHRARRDRWGVARRIREAEGIEALACAIRLKALRECLSIVGGVDGEPG